MALAVGVLALVWGAAVVFLLLSARGQLLDARRDLNEVRDDVDGAELLDVSTTERLASIEADLDDARGKTRSPLVAPLRWLPYVGRQVRSADALTTATRDVVRVSIDTLERVRAAMADAAEPDTDRLAMVETIRSSAADAERSLASVEFGPDEALLGPLATARVEVADGVDELRQIVGDAAVAARGLGALLDSEDCYLLFAANNAEMRAGSGMFLQAGELCFRSGEFTLGPMTPTGELSLPDPAVPISDPDLEALWGRLRPNEEFRNLALSPRFDVNAALAARMWEASQGHAVAGVLAVDPVTLAVLLGSTGPVEVDGRTYASGDVVEQLLVTQYEDFLDPAFDDNARRDRLGTVAAAAVAAFNDGGWSIDTLVDDLPDAVAGRHLLGWSSDATVQAGFAAMGMSGTLEPTSVAVSVINRGASTGGGKLDAFLEIEADLQVARETTGGRRQASLVVTIANTVARGVPTYDASVTDETRFGVYRGVLAVNLPGTAANGRIEVDGHAVSLYTVGADGPTRQVSVLFDLGAELDQDFTVRFDLPDDVASVIVEPSARVPATQWTAPRVDQSDDRRFSLQLYN